MANGAGRQANFGRRGSAGTAVTEIRDSVRGTGKPQAAEGRSSTQRKNALFHSYDSIERKVARPKRILEMPSDANTALRRISIAALGAIHAARHFVVFTAHTWGSPW
ncbi:hypothetical protein MASR1M50_17170 [Burkholderiales bacterium]